MRPDLRGREVDAHEVERRDVRSLAVERAGVALAALAVVEEPRGIQREDRVPAVGLALDRPVARRERVVADEPRAVPMDPEQRRRPDRVDVVAVGREPRDRRLGQRAGVEDRERLRIQREELGGLRRGRVGWIDRKPAAEVLRHERAVG